MTDKTPQTGPCPGCNTEKRLRKYSSTKLCADCAKIADAIKSEHTRMAKLKKIVRGPHHEPVEDLPEVLDAVRYRTKDREHNSWYVSVSEISGEPVEIFASTAFDRDQHLQSRISNLTTITRLISLILRHISLGEELTLDKTITQLHRSSRQPNDLPEMLVRVLSNYSNTPGDVYHQEHESP